jgi:hypothetical protein
MSDPSTSWERRIFMFMTIASFGVVGIVFAILHFFVKGVWPYYVPAALSLLTVWLKIIHPSWSEEVENLQTTVSQTDPSAACFYLTALSIIYGIACVFMGFWVPLGICVVVLFLSFTMRFVHPH